MKKKKWKREIPACEKGLPSVLAKARDGIHVMLERPSIVWSNSRTKIMDSRRFNACERILTAMVERTQLGLAGGAFELFRDEKDVPTYRPLNVRDLLKLTGLTEASFYRAWRELQNLGFVRADRQKKKFIAPGEFRVGDVIRMLTLKFWHMVGVGAETFQRACRELSEKTKRLLEIGKNAVIRLSKRVYSSKAQEKAAKAQQKQSDAINDLGRDAARCWTEKKLRGENVFDCYGCAKVCSEYCQMCLNEERAKLAAGGMSYEEQGYFARLQKQEETQARWSRLQAGILLG